MTMMKCEIVMESNEIVYILFYCITCTIQSSCYCYIVLDLHERPVLTFYMNFAMYAQKQQLQSTPPPNPPHIALCSCLVHVLINCFTMFQNMRHGQTKYTGGS